MIFEAKTYTPGEYEALLLALYRANGPDLDNELEFYNSKVSHLNPDFAIHAKATLKTRSFLDQAKELRPTYLAEFERALLEALNIPPVELPNFILSDRRLKLLMGRDVHSIVNNTSVQNDFEILLEQALNNLPESKRLTFLNWFLQGLNNNLEAHKAKCNTPNCQQEKSYEYRISRIESLIEMEIPAPAIATTTNAGTTTKKIQWLGTQKELAELFIYLKAKGWIADFEPETIKQCFTKANTIQQLFKPGTYTDALGGTFEQVFTLEYESKFHAIFRNQEFTKD